MIRRVFFCFNYDRDIWRANVIRDSEALQSVSQVGFWDRSLWENRKLEGDDAVKRLIDEGLEGTSVTAVLIGAETASSRLVRYEIQQSYDRGNGLLGIYIHNIPDPRGRSDFVGANPFRALQIYFDRHARQVQTHDWTLDDGYRNIGSWIDEAARLDRG